MKRLAYVGALAGALVLASCFSGGTQAGAASEEAAVMGATPVAAPPPIDQRNPASTETATFALG